MYPGWILLLSNALLVVLVWWSGHIALALVLAALWSGGQIWFWGRTARRQGEQLRQLDEAAPDDPTWVEAFHPELARALEDLAERIQQRVHRLESENNRLEVILESITEAILVVDRDGRVVLANKALANLFGLDPPLEGLLTAEVVRYSTIQGALAGCLAEGRRREMEVELTGAPERHLDMQVAPVFEGNECIGAVAVLYDITRLRELERMRRDFVANVSHELRTPLTAIKGYAEILSDSALDDRETARRFTGIIENHADRLTHLLGDLLDLSRLESDQLEVELIPCELKPLVDTAVGSVSQAAAQKQIAIHCDVPPSVQVICDPKLIEQALINLLDNAVKYTPAGGKVRVGTRPVEDTDRLAIYVEDTGVGIPSEDLGRIFERFYRVDKGRSRDLGGTGLGLSIVRHIAEVHGEQVSVQSKLGAGTTFSFELQSRVA